MESEQLSELGHKMLLFFVELAMAEGLSDQESFDLLGLFAGDSIVRFSNTVRGRKDLEAGGMAAITLTKLTEQLNECEALGVMVSLTQHVNGVKAPTEFPVQIVNLGNVAKKGGPSN